MRRDDDSRIKYQSTFVIYSNNKTLETQHVNATFTNYMAAVEEAQVVSEGINIVIFIIATESKVYGGIIFRR